MSREALLAGTGKHLSSLIIWSVVTLVLAQQHAALFALLALPFVLFYILARLVFLLLRKRALGQLGVTFALIAVSCLLVATVHLVRYKEARQMGEEIVQKIRAYKEMHGVYPGSSREFGIPPEQLKSRRVYYSLGDGEPVLFYSSTLMPFDIYWYNFGQSAWEYRPD